MAYTLITNDTVLSTTQSSQPPTINLNLTANQTDDSGMYIADSDTDEALLYIIAVLLFYAFSLTLLMVKYIKSEKEDQKFSYMYQVFVKREQFEKTERKNTMMQIHPPKKKPESIRTTFV